MKLKSIDIKNFKSIKKLHLEMTDILALVGKNNSGKSNIMEAIKLCLEPDSINHDYFHQDLNGNFPDELSIELKFSVSVSDDLILHTFDKILKIRISATSSNKIPRLRQEIYSHLINESNFKFWDITPRKFKTIEKTTIEYFGKKFQTGTDYNLFIKKLIHFHKECMNDIPSKMISGYILVSKLDDETRNKLPQCQLIDPTRQISDEIKLNDKSPLLKILNLVVNSIGNTTNISKIFDQIQTLKNIDLFSNVESHIKNAMNDIFIDYDIKLNIDLADSLSDILKNVNININDGYRSSDITNFGMGLQRIFIIALFRAYAEIVNDATKLRPTIFLIEEPENYLHPHAQQSLYDAFKKIKKYNQIIYSTHSNLFIDINYYNEIGLIYKNNNSTNIKQVIRSIFNKNFSKKFNEGFFATKIILVEGISDMRYILAFQEYNQLPKFYLKDISIFECGGIDTIKSIMEIFEQFNIPCYPIIDHDQQIKNMYETRFNITQDIVESVAFDNGAIMFKDLEYVIHGAITKDVINYFNNHIDNINWKLSDDIMTDREKFICMTKFKKFKNEFSIQFSNYLKIDNVIIPVPKIYDEIFKKLNLLSE